MCHLWHFWHKWHILHMSSIMHQYVNIVNMGVKRSVRTSRMQPSVFRYSKIWFYCWKNQKFDNLVFPLYLLKIPLYNSSGDGNVDFYPGELIFIFFNCTMVQNIHEMGTILQLNTLEILGHPRPNVKHFVKEVFLLGDSQ